MAISPRPYEDSLGSTAVLWINKLMKFLVCVAVREEMRKFETKSPLWREVRVLKTGMGPINARHSIRNELSQSTPKVVISCGFAGGLNPKLRPGNLLFSTSDVQIGKLFGGDFEHNKVKYLRSDRVISTSAEKRLIFATQGLDAVEMESWVIAEEAERLGIPSITLRVVLDSAAEDLPLDFSQFMDAQRNMIWSRFCWYVIRNPKTIRVLTPFNKEVSGAAGELAKGLKLLLEKMH